MYYQAMSALAFADRCMWWSSAFTDADSSMRLRMNVLSGLTTDAAWFRRPIRERRSEELPGFVVYPLGDVVAMTSCLSGSLRRVFEIQNPLTADISGRRL